MKTLPLILLLALSLSGFSFSQQSLTYNSIPRNIALGESFVAYPDAGTALSENPVSLISLKGISLYYSRTNMKWFPGDEDIFLYSAGAFLKTPIGYWGISYSRFVINNISFSTMENPQGIAKGNIYDHTFALSYSNNITEHIAAGMNVKYYGTGQEIKTFEPGYSLYPDLGEYKNPLLLDFGILYSAGAFVKKDLAHDKIRLGVSLQNFGTDFKHKDATGSQKDFEVIKLPRNLRAGFSYELSILNSANSPLINFIFTGEYRKWLNPDEFNKSSADSWGMGMEATLFDLVSLRMGGYAPGGDNIFGRKGVFSMRYGLGINLPVELLGLKYPIILSMDYALVPVNLISYLYNDPSRNTNSFSFRINYLPELF